MSASLLLLSNSANPDAPYLAHAREWLAEAFQGCRTIAFVPYAVVTKPYDEYAARVREAFVGLPHEVRSVHEADEPSRCVAQCDAVLVGGGNTFQLLRRMYRTGLMEAVRRAVGQGKPYVGWSAGANLASPTIRTTNDMPIAEPPSMEAFGFVPFQINPHYTDATPPGHMGETRADRLAEFVALNPVPVVGLPEGTALRLREGRLARLGPHAPRLFTPEEPTGRPLEALDLSFLLTPRA